MSYTDFLEMYARDVKKAPETLLAQKPLSFPVSTNQRGEALVDFFQRTTDLELKGKRVLDVGCAYGGLSIALANAGAKVSAIDVNPKFISYAQANVKDSAEVDLRAVDASSIGVRKVFERGSFDLVVLNDVLEHIYDTTSLVSNLDYLLNERGLVYFKVPNGSSPRFILSEGHRKIFGLSLLDPDCWFHLYPKRASIFYRPLGFFKAIFAYHGFGDISFVNEENVFPRFPIKKLRKQVRDIALHAREFEYPDKTVRVYLRHAIARFREEFEYDIENQGEDYVRFKYGSYFFTGFAGRPQSGLKARSPVRHVLGMGAIIDPHGERSPQSADSAASEAEGDDTAEPPPSAEFCTNCGARLAPGMACSACGGPGPGSNDGEGPPISAEDGAGTAPAESASAVGESSTPQAAADAGVSPNDGANRVFRPSFDVRELRQCIAQYPLRPYERLERDSVSRDDLQRLADQGWQKTGSPLISLAPPINWSVEDRGVKHRLHAWEPLSTLLAGAEKFGDPRWFAAAYAAVMDWLRQFQSFAQTSRTYAELDQALGQREDLVWYDMGVGFRCYRLAYVLDVAARDPAYSDADIELLTQALYFHNEALSRPSFFRSHNNHGVYQALGQLACARRFPWLPKMADFGGLAEERLVRLCREHFFESGVHREHSPGYQYMVLNSLIGARNAGLLDQPECAAILTRAERALMWMIQPDGRVCAIGDTDPRSVRLSNPGDLIYEDAHLRHVISGGKTGLPPPATVQAYREAGYVFARLPAHAGQPPQQWSYLAQIAGFHSRIHKHADHLSFAWFERGQDVLVDAGRYGYLGRTEPRSALAREGYWYSNPKRMFVESTRAHNTVEIDGRDLPRVGVEPFGSAIVHAEQQQDLAVTHCKAIYFDSIEHERLLVLCPGRYLLVIDALVDVAGGTHAFTQRFNFAPHWDVAARAEGFVARSTRDAAEVLQVRSLTSRSTMSNVVRGQHEPQLLGWYSDAENSLVPCSSVAFGQSEASQELFVTLFAFGAEVAVKQLAPEVERLADLGEVSFAIDGVPTTVQFSHEDPALTRIKARGPNSPAASSGGAPSASLRASVDEEPLRKVPLPPARRLCITVDVEAQPGRVAGGHVDKLIWGRFPDGTCGIDELMTAADRYGAKLTMFLDYPEQQLYGDALLDVGREIHRRGHDLQLHLHQQFFSDVFYRRHGIARLHDLNLVSPEEARVFVDFLCEQHQNITGSAPTAFRGGGYRFNATLLRELQKRGVKVDSSYDCSNANRIVDLGPRKQFAWEGGVFELPVSSVFDFMKTKRHFAYNFNAAMLEPPRTIDAVVRHFKFLERFYTKFGEDAVAVMVMHSWSLLRLGESGHFEYGGRAALERFEALLEALHGAADFVTSADVASWLADDRLERGPACELPECPPREPAPKRAAKAASPSVRVAPAPSNQAKDVPRQPLPSVEGAVAASPAAATEPVCPICALPVSQFQDFHGPRRRCPTCGSVERQRVMADLYGSLVQGSPWSDLRGKRVLIIAPSVSELKFLQRIGVGEIVTADVRPEVKPTLVVDVCNMPQVADESFDAVFGSYVLTCVYDARAAVAEFTRVLRPDGVLYTSDPIAKGKRTQEYEDLERITAWYGKDAYEKYRVGSFRALGELDVGELFEPPLSMHTVVGTDVATGTPVAWLVAHKSRALTSARGAAESAPASLAAPRLPEVDTLRLNVQGCPLCGDKLEVLEKDQNCPGCGSRARLRALHSVIAECAEDFRRTAPGLPVLAFAMTDDERQVLRPAFERFKSVSLFGRYGADHELGVDARDLSRYADGTYAGHYGSLIFDYFDEHERALTEAFRVLAPGGVLLTHIAPYRLTDDMAPARVATQIAARPGYFDYLPKDVSLPSVKVGRAWFIAALRRAGFEVRLAQVTDVASGIVVDWFIGVKPGTSAVEPTPPTSTVVGAPAQVASTPEPGCAICGTPVSQFADLGGPRRLCTGCGAVERQRVFADLYPGLVADAAWRDLRNKRVLAIAPNSSELRLLRAAGAREIVTVDIRAEAVPELVADVCSMPEVRDGSFDAVFGCYVLTSVHTVRAAITEFARILVDGGVFYTSEPVVHGQHTEESTDLAQCTPWYGVEAFEKYRVGCHRTLGELDIDELFSSQFALQQVTGTDLATGNTVTWQLARKLVAGARPQDWQDRVRLGSRSDTGPVSLVELSVQGCPVCGDSLETLDHGQNCPKCGSRARLRALQPVLGKFAKQLEQGPLHLPMLGFAMSSGERELLRSTYPQLKSVSLFGQYGQDHEVGVDARDLSRYADGSFSGHFGCLVFDYFHEHQLALAEAFRVVAPGGALLTLIAGYRLVDGMTPAHVTGQIQKREGYFDYLKEGDVLANIEVGREWFVNELRRAGFEAHLCRVTDIASGLVLDWFVGIKPTNASVSVTGASEASAGSTPSGAVKPKVVGLSEARAHTYSTPLDPETGFKRVVVSVSVPAIPTVASGCEFAHHEFITDGGVAGDRVFALQRGGVLLSDDLGEHWDYVATPDTRDVRLWNAFTSRAGNVLLQGLASNEAAANSGPPLFVCDASLNVRDELQLGREAWHGTRSIDESHGTIIYAEYPENSVKYRPDFAQRRAELLPQCRDAAVFRSTDGGRSWAKVFEKSWQEIRHFHTVAADPHQAGVWYLSSGDKPHECRVWRSQDDGLSWHDISADGSTVELHPGMQGQHQAVNRYTDIVVLPDRLLWGSDDLLGNLSQFTDPKATLANRVGARVFHSPKTAPLEPTSIGFVGNHVRSIVDVGPGYLLLTEAKGFASGSRPQVLLLFKSEPYRLVELFTVDRYLARGTGFSYSRASRVAKNGRFFSYRDAYDVFAGGPRLLRWDVAFE